MVIECPKLLQMPEKLVAILRLIDKYRYFLIEGGRGGGKSQAIARLFLFLTDIYNLRCVCGREIQNSIEESVYTLLADLISKYNLAFHVGAKEIDHPDTKSTIRFRGFREQGSINIKGLEGIDMLWIDEAQAITKGTLDVIIPTIRKNKAKVFFTMNRLRKHDPVFDEFSARPDCLHIKINYDENEFCSDALRNEAELCRLKNYDDYRHIWLGEPSDDGVSQVFHGVDKIVSIAEFPLAPNEQYSYVLGVDLARSVDYTVLTVVNKQLKRVVYWERLESDNRTSWNYQVERIEAVSNKYHRALVVLDSSGVGDPIAENLMRRNVNLYHTQTDTKETPGVKFTSISKENLIEKLKVAIELEMIWIPNIKILIDELKEYETELLPSGRYRYSAPDGRHDDCVISLALAVWGMNAEIYVQDVPKVVLTPKDEFWRAVKSDLAPFNDNDSEEGSPIDEGALINE